MLPIVRWVFVVFFFFLFFSLCLRENLLIYSLMTNREGGGRRLGVFSLSSQQRITLMLSADGVNTKGPALGPSGRGKGKLNLGLHLSCSLPSPSPYIEMYIVLNELSTVNGCTALKHGGGGGEYSSGITAHFIQVLKVFSYLR